MVMIEVMIFHLFPDGGSSDGPNTTKSRARSIYDQYKYTAAAGADTVARSTSPVNCLLVNQYICLKRRFGNISISLNNRHSLSLVYNLFAKTSQVNFSSRSDCFNASLALYSSLIWTLQLCDILFMPPLSLSPFFRPLCKLAQSSINVKYHILLSLIISLSIVLIFFYLLDFLFSLPPRASLNTSAHLSPSMPTSPHRPFPLLNNIRLTVSLLKFTICLVASYWNTFFLCL